MRWLAFAERNRKEILRDPLTLLFGIAFPLVLLFLLSAIQAHIPVDLFRIAKLVPGIAVFGLSFVALFSGMLIARDRETSFLARLFASPLTASEFILGYTLPMLPMAVAQCAVCFLAAFLLKLPVTIGVLWALIALLPTAVLFIAIGVLMGSIFNDKQVGSVCGALLTNLSAWLSGTWFDLNLVGGAFKKIAYALPFVHAVDAARSALAGNWSAALPHLVWVSAYAAVVFVFAILAFRGKMRG